MKSSHLLMALLSAGVTISVAQTHEVTPKLTAQEGTPQFVGSIPPLRSIPQPRLALQAGAPAAPREVPMFRIPRQKPPPGPTATTAAAARIAPSAPTAPQTIAAMPAPLLTFAGVGNLDGVYPPDANGDVGPDHYVEMVNMHFCIYSKTNGAALIAPMKMSQLYAAAGFPAPASTSDDGDPVVLYDHLANRWLISQFIVSVTPCHEVIAVSKTSDPTGGWWLYDFAMPGNLMNDYPHFGVWPDGYYMTDNQFDPANNWAGAGVFVFDRARMLTGNTNATFQYFNLFGANANYGGMLPCDLDGPPPPAGAPNYFAMVDDSFVNPFDAMYIWKFHVDWTNSANSTFGSNGRPNFTNVVQDFNSIFSGGRNNIPQKGTKVGLDAISDRIMHRLQYRNFGSFESLVVCHTVNVTNSGNHAGVRYYQFRRDFTNAAFDVAEQGAFAPDALHRWMGSAAMDGAGNLAIGYSVSGTNMFPSIRYAGRMASDPPGGLVQGEATLWDGSGAQTGSANRWGDYTMLAVDPVDDRTFWYVNEYMPTTSAAGWTTRIGCFRMSSATVGAVRGVVSNALTGARLDGATILAGGVYGTLTHTDGTYQISLPTGTWSIVAGAAEFRDAAPQTVTVALDATNVADFGLLPMPLRVRPTDDWTAGGVEGGPFSPAVFSYAVSNAAAAPFDWTLSHTSQWFTASTLGGALPAGAMTTITLTISAPAYFLAPGAYSARLVFSNQTSGSVVTRNASLVIGRRSFYQADFSQGLPAGWSVRVNGNSNGYWRFDDPGQRGNLTGGQGVFAIADSDQAGSMPFDSELRTGALNLGPVTGNGLLEFKTDYRYYFDTADVDFSTNGAAGPWSNVWRRTSDMRGPTNISIALPAGALGQTNVMARFHYYNANWSWWWEVDDVAVYGDHIEPFAVRPANAVAVTGYYGSAITPASWMYYIANTSAVPLEWTSACDADWLSWTPTGGSLMAHMIGPVEVRMNASAAFLPVGTHTTALVISNLTAGVAVTRSVSLTIAEPLEVSPASSLTSSGLQGGPFQPAEAAYTLRNHSAADIGWTSRWSAAWLTVAPAGGLLLAGQALTSTAALVAGALTTPGAYQDVLVFSNRLTGGSETRTAAVTVIERTGQIGVYDSIAPTNDLRLPFGVVTAGGVWTGRVTVVNTNPTLNLQVLNIYFGFYRDSFGQGGAAGWRPDAPANWTVTNGAYRAAAPTDDYMTALYTNQAWGDASIQARVARTGNEFNSGGLVLRASADFDANATGTAYLFLASTNQYAVFWFNGATYGTLQNWTLSPSFKPGTNILAASGQGNLLRFFINGTLVWEGTDTRYASGFSGLVGHTAPISGAATVFDFSNIVIGDPLTPSAAVGRKQVYLNANGQAKSVPAGPDQGTTSAPVEPSLLSAQAFADAPTAVAVDALPYRLTHLPALPATLPPGAALGFDVIFAPANAGANDNAATIVNNDNVQPVVSVTLSGRLEAGALTGRVTDWLSSNALANAGVTVSGGGTNRIATTDTNGQYTLPLPVGTYDLTVTAPAHATNAASGILLTTDGMVVTQNVVLAGIAQITATAGPNGAIQPSGSVQVVQGQSTQFLSSANTYYHVGDIQTNGRTLGIAFTNTDISHVFWWSNVVANGTVTAVFAENLAASNTPEWWLAQYGWTNQFDAHALADPDGDNAQTWEEFIAGTDPTNALSVFGLAAISRPTNAPIRIQWASAAGRKYSVLWGTHLMPGVQAFRTNLPALPPTNALSDTAHTNDTPGFYRLTVTYPR